MAFSVLEGKLGICVFAIDKRGCAFEARDQHLVQHTSGTSHHAKLLQCF